MLLSEDHAFDDMLFKKFKSKFYMVLWGVVIAIYDIHTAVYLFRKVQ